MTTVTDRAAAIGWETRQFCDATRGAAVGMSPRAAYQLVLFGRAVLVDLRPEAQRRSEGEIDPALRPVVVAAEAVASLGLTWLATGTRVLVIGPAGHEEYASALAPLGVPATDVVGGVRAWRAAGLPLAA